MPYRRPFRAELTQNAASRVTLYRLPQTLWAVEDATWKEGVKGREMIKGNGREDLLVEDDTVNDNSITYYNTLQS